jgi:hypothetical protein
LQTVCFCPGLHNCGPSVHVRTLRCKRKNTPIFFSSTGLWMKITRKKEEI